MRGHNPMSPAEFARRMRALTKEGMQPIDVRAHAVGLMALCLGSIGYQDGVDAFLEITKDIGR